ncbi:MAG: sporadic carbohydrate cluster protein, LIC12192 family [Methylococcales bacterium]|jgi:sporadic carbohydrate cluster protein (TIGR04323 family)|nr:sporadic carbohydrate cluster protein, LIC12192 family [Methylococcales bacterium]MBT7408722.1 sporadic carbohydrate cluster protein, LIC12192 family [Methylococcales bacterium]
MNNGFRGYVSSRPFLGHRAPQHIQNLVIRDYCQRHQLNFLLSVTEYAMPNCFMMLEQVIQELPDLQGAILYSLFQLPKNKQKRQSIYQHFVQDNKSVHFAVENFKIESVDDIQSIEDIWQVKLTLPGCFGTGTK